MEDRLKRARPLSDLPRLVVHLADGTQVEHRVRGRETTIGRDPSNRICIPDHLVSKFHAKLIVSGNQFTLVDLGSVNRTRVNEDPITRATLKYGDEVQFARVKCRLLPPFPES